MRVITIRDYPETVGRLIEQHLITDYTLTGYYGDSGLEWILHYMGERDIRLFEIVISEYIIGTVDLHPGETVELDGGRPLVKRS